MLSALVLCLASCLARCPQEAPPQRVACVGDGWTSGSGIEDRARQSYPAALRWRLGAAYVVRTFATDDDTSSFAPNIAVLIAAGPPHDLRRRVDALRDQAEPPRILLVDAMRAPAPEATKPSVPPAAGSLVTVQGGLTPNMLTRDGTPDPHGADRLAARVAAAILGRDLDPTTTPVPSPEWRAGPAGWVTGDWWDQHEAIKSLIAANPDLQLVFVGDSITQALTGTGNRLTAPDGGRAIDQVFGSVPAIGIGIAGDRTQHVLFRLQQGELAALHARAIVLQIGINNVLAGDSGEATARGIEAIVAELRQQQPQAKVLLCGPFPAGATADHPARAAVVAIHARLARLADGHAIFHHDLSSLFIDDDGKPTGNLAPDAVHVTETGREAWLAAIEPLLRTWL